MKHNLLEICVFYIVRPWRPNCQVKQSPVGASSASVQTDNLSLSSWRKYFRLSTARERGRGDGFKIKLAVRTWQPSSGSWLVDSEEIRVKHQDLDLVNLNIKIDLYSLLCINHLRKRWILNTKFSDKFSIFFILIISEYKQLWAIKFLILLILDIEIQSREQG